jgi:hypothetical protein
MDQNDMRTLYRGLSMDVSDQISVHLAKLFKSRSLKCEKMTDDGHQGHDVQVWSFVFSLEHTDI